MAGKSRGDRGACGSRGGRLKFLNESGQAIAFTRDRPLIGDWGFARVPDLQRQFYQVGRWKRDQARFERTELCGSGVWLECSFHVGGAGFRRGRAHLVGGEERPGYGRGLRFLNLTFGAWV